MLSVGSRALSRKQFFEPQTCWRADILPNEKDPHDRPNPSNFEEALTQLETIVHALEDGQIGLADALGRYEEGVKLLKQCYGLLEKTERRN